MPHVANSLFRGTGLLILFAQSSVLQTEDTGQEPRNSLINGTETYRIVNTNITSVKYISNHRGVNIMQHLHPRKHKIRLARSR